MFALRAIRSSLLPFAIVSGLILASPASAESEQERRVKTAILFKILRFVSWPESLETGTGLTLCADSSDPFTNSLSVLSGRNIAGALLTVQPTGAQASVEPEPVCHIRFHSSAFHATDPSWHTTTSHKPVLTISDAAGFAEAGGMVNLVIRNNRVAFKINVDATTDASIRVSPALLKLADVVRAPRVSTNRSEQE